jgi:hypothetical protein
MAATAKRPSPENRDQWIERLGVIVSTIEQMEDDERLALFTYIKSRYAKFWPSDGY